MWGSADKRMEISLCLFIIITKSLNIVNYLRTDNMYANNWQAAGECEREREGSLNRAISHLL